MIQDRGKRSFKNLMIIWCVAVVTLCIGGVSMGYMEDWSSLDSVYWVMITATSIGYGDFSPSSDRGKVLACVFLPFAVGLMSASIGQTVNFFMERRAVEQSKVLFMTDFALDDFMHIDAKDTDKITRAEYLAFLLIMMKKVDQPLIDRLNTQFDQLDADSNGYLEPVDLEIIKNKKVSVVGGGSVALLGLTQIGSVRVKSGLKIGTSGRNSKLIHHPPNPPPSRWT
jgi:hypothetical protein